MREPALNRHGYGLRAVTNVQLRQQARNVSLHGGLRDSKHSSNFYMSPPMTPVEL